MFRLRAGFGVQTVYLLWIWSLKCAAWSQRNSKSTTDNSFQQQLVSPNLKVMLLEKIIYVQWWHPKLGLGVLDGIWDMGYSTNLITSETQIAVIVVNTNHSSHIHWLWQWWRHKTGGETQVRRLRWRNKQPKKHLTGWRDAGNRAKLMKLMMNRCAGRLRVSKKGYNLQLFSTTTSPSWALSHSLWLADSYIAGLRGLLKQIHGELCLYYETFLLCF